MSTLAVNMDALCGYLLSDRQGMILGSRPTDVCLDLGVRLHVDFVVTYTGSGGRVLVWQFGREALVVERKNSVLGGHYVPS